MFEITRSALNIAGFSVHWYGLLIALTYVITKGKAPLKKSFSCAGCPNASTCHTACTEKGEE